MKDLILNSAALIALLALIVGAVAGWAMNLVALVHLLAANAPVDILLVGRVMGIFFAPLGIALGWLA